MELAVAARGGVKSVHAPGERALPLRAHGAGGRATRRRTWSACRAEPRFPWSATSTAGVTTDRRGGEAVPAAPGGQPGALDGLRSAPGPRGRHRVRGGRPRPGPDGSAQAHRRRVRRHWPWKTPRQLDKTLAALGRAPALSGHQASRAGWRSSRAAAGASALATASLPGRARGGRGSLWPRSRTGSKAAVKALEACGQRALGVAADAAQARGCGSPGGGRPGAASAGSTSS